MTTEYVYAILEGEHRLDLGGIGLPDGLTSVSTLSVEGLTAVMSEYSGPPFPQLAKTELLRRLTIHQRVIEQSMAAGPLLPVKFGTALASVVEVHDVLYRWQSRLGTAFEELGNVVEIEVAAVWDLKSTFAEISRQPEIASLASATVGCSPDETLASRIQIGSLVKESLDKRREEYRRWVVSDLSPLARDVQTNPLPSDEMVMNSAFLVECSQIDDFFEGVHRIDRTLDDRLTFRCIGPLPPYSFATVEILRPDLAEVEAARQLLELGEIASVTDLKSSFRRLSTLWHPDRNPGNPASAQRFAALSGAYATLLACGRGQQVDDARSRDNFQLDFRKTAIESGLYLTVGRLGTQRNTIGDERHEPSLVV